jgi:geranylgeranyl reductase family protein
MSSIHADILIIGAGPGGLACAKVLAEQGRKVLVLERRPEIGQKVCAGGITWDGLLRVVPEELVERSFPEQYIFSSCQQTVVQEKHPIIATISRKVLGQWMAEQARQAGAELLIDSKVTSIDGLQVTANCNGTQKTFVCSQLVGADGANSIVRQSLGIPSEARGIGINFQLPGVSEQMEWHLSTRNFGSGYGWIFPHKNTVSVGAYSPQAHMSSGRLKRNLLRWAEGRGFRQLQDLPCQAGLINYDYQGYHFGTTWLVGDAAGLASGLTGEGIYPAIISGKTVAEQILNPGHHNEVEFSALLRRQQQHRRITNLLCRHAACSLVLTELFLLFLRWHLLHFHALEMSPVRPKK